MKTKRMCLLAACAIGLGALPGLADDKPVGEKFRTMDTDGDGRISRFEHEEATTEMFSKWDTNADGKVTDLELRNPQASSASGQGSGEKVEHKFDKFDQNKDGQVTKSECQMTATSKFNEMDTNRDGYLSQEEMSSGKSKEHSR